MLVPISFRSVGTEILYMTEVSQPRIFFVSRDHKDEVEAIASRMQSVETFVCLEERLDSMAYYEDLVKGSASTEPDLAIEEDDGATVLWTSGSTGNPKGVIHTHKSWMRGAMVQLLHMGLRADDVALIFVPAFHMAGMWPFIAHLLAGASVVLLKTFDAAESLETVARERATTINLVPTHLVDLVEATKKREGDYSSLRLVAFGAAPMHTDVFREATRTFGNIFMHVYGLTECTSAVAYQEVGGYVEGEASEQARRRNLSCGRENFTMEARVVNEDGEDVNPGEVGEIIARGDPVMKGYLNLPEETSRALRGGWLHTGDLATVDKEGYIYVTDRKDFKIISGGENIYPKEVEDILVLHPAVREAAVVGIPDKRWGEAVKAIIVLKEGYEADEQEIIEFCRGKMAGYKKPKSVDFASDLPKSSAGKILKTEIKNRYWQEGTGASNRS